MTNASRLRHSGLSTSTMGPIDDRPEHGIRPPASFHPAHPHSMDRQSVAQRRRIAMGDGFYWKFPDGRSIIKWFPARMIPAESITG
jgi:elongation factor P hydroxylase